MTNTDPAEWGRFLRLREGADDELAECITEQRVISELKWEHLETKLETWKMVLTYGGLSYSLKDLQDDPTDMVTKRLPENSSFSIQSYIIKDTKHF